MPNNFDAVDPSTSAVASKSDVISTTPMVTSVKSLKQGNIDHITTVANVEPLRNVGAPFDNDYNPGSSEIVQPVSSVEPQPDVKKLSGATIALTMTPLCLSVMLSSLDITIVTPAIPTIVRSFNSVSGYVWIGTAFILASTAITPVWGSVADIWGRKPIMLINLTIFLCGSLICALAPRMDALIAGRAVQGLGASGMGTMVNVIICDTFSLRDRGLYLAITSLVWAVGSAVGPIIGGTITTRSDWRWCFWINLPIGAVVFFVLLFFLKLPSPNTPVMPGLKAIDWTGGTLIVGAVLMILLGLEFGDIIFPWSSTTVICLIIFGAVVIGIFIFNEWKFAANPVIPLRLFSKRSSVAAYVVFACNFYILIGLSYYLPLYSQSVLGVNALLSGVYLVPLIVASSLAAACAGIFIQQTGIYLPVMYLSQVILTLGVGLFINLKFGEGLAKLFIFEIIAGIGIGMNIDPPLLAALAASTVVDTAAVNATMSFFRSIATAIAIVLGGVIFQNQMNAANQGLADQLGSQIAIKFNGDHATANVELIGSLSADQQAAIRRVYFEALKAVWIMYVAAAGLSLISTLFVRAHHLGLDTKSAVLGLDRAKRAEQQSNNLPKTVPSNLLGTRRISLSHDGGHSLRKTRLWLRNCKIVS